VDGGAHIPVLLDEVLQALNVGPESVVVDATYGRGGHAEAILNRLGESGRLLALDRDPHAVGDARRRLGADPRVTIEHAPFSQLAAHCDRCNLSGHVTGVLFDLGVSSPQLEEPARGFSFRQEGPLDMRMDPSTGISAAEWVNGAEEGDIVRVLRDYGEERFARRIARAIVRARAVQPIETTRALAAIVADAVPTRERGQDPATRTFQAIRIYVNRELDELETALPQAVRVLSPGGRLAVISFHSLEDRRVKHFMRGEARPPELPPGFPVAPPFHPRLKLVGRAIHPSAEEVRRNPRSRSALLRVAERTGAPHV
jgi:16S rRNA (cytosine1402-N4)-methyltransferase